VTSPMRRADLLVSTALYEPAGIAALQAMACGTPVAATAAGAERDAVIDMTTGLLELRRPLPKHARL